MNTAKLYLDGKLIAEGGTVELTPLVTVPLLEPFATKVYEFSCTLVAPTQDDRMQAVFRALGSCVGQHWIVARVDDLEVEVPTHADDTPEVFMDRAIAMLEEAAKARSGVATPGQNAPPFENA